MSCDRYTKYYKSHGAVCPFRSRRRHGVHGAPCDWGIKDTQGFQLYELDQALSKLGNKINTQNIIIMGDFNLPNIDWGKHAIRPNSGYSSIAASKLLTIMEEHGLTQHVNVPIHTQGNSNN